VKSAASVGLLLALLTGVVIATIVYLNAETIVALLTATTPESTSRSIAAAGAKYLSVLALGLPLIASGDTAEAVFIGRGDSKTPLLVNVVAVVVDLLLDPIQIFGIGPIPELSIRGVAAATIAGFGVSGGLALALLAWKTNVDPLSCNLTEKFTEEATDILRIGSPTAGQVASKHVPRAGLVSVVFAVGGQPALLAYTIG
jgi:Na+-driven multidrug efflux pump